MRIINIAEFRPEASNLRTLKILPRNLNEIVRPWIQLQEPDLVTIHNTGFSIHLPQNSFLSVTHLWLGHPPGSTLHKLAGKQGREHLVVLLIN